MASMYSKYGESGPRLPPPLVSWKFPFPELFLSQRSLVFTSLMLSPTLLFTSEINITLYPAHILDPAWFFFHQWVCV